MAMARKHKKQPAPESVQTQINRSDAVDEEALVRRLLEMTCPELEEGEANLAVRRICSEAL
ncbi:hypothetical protein [Desulfohalovibrio reitneri]|uniref:hypothetical protein n=1 Tax=Desulfohalovibrio reitneri TaxID=1307759 RepID=UPI0004A761ED|nr:hypothetical protein [Desulfohalovibrio reitneri]